MVATAKKDTAEFLGYCHKPVAGFPRGARLTVADLAHLAPHKIKALREQRFISDVPPAPPRSDSAPIPTESPAHARLRLAIEWIADRIGNPASLDRNVILEALRRGDERAGAGSVLVGLPEEARTVVALLDAALAAEEAA